MKKKRKQYVNCYFLKLNSVEFCCSILHCLCSMKIIFHFLMLAERIGTSETGTRIRNDWKAELGETTERTIGGWIWPAQFKLFYGGDPIERGSRGKWLRIAKKCFRLERNFVWFKMNGFLLVCSEGYSLCNYVWLAIVEFHLLFSQFDWKKVENEQISEWGIEKMNNEWPGSNIFFASQSVIVD